MIRDISSSYKVFITKVRSSTYITTNKKIYKSIEFKFISKTKYQNSRKFKRKIVYFNNK